MLIFTVLSQNLTDCTKLTVLCTNRLINTKVLGLTMCAYAPGHLGTWAYAPKPTAMPPYPYAYAPGCALARVGTRLGTCSGLGLGVGAYCTIPLSFWIGVKTLVLSNCLGKKCNAKTLGNSAIAVLALKPRKICTFRDTLYIAD